MKLNITTLNKANFETSQHNEDSPIEADGTDRMQDKANSVVSDHLNTAIQAYCKETKRVAVIGAYPDRLHGLIGELSTRCLDVLAFHRFDPAVMNSLPVELVIIDAGAAAETGELQDILQAASVSRHAANILWLVQKEMPLENVTTGMQMSWPVPLAEAISQIMRILMEGQTLPEGPSGEVYQFKDLTVDPKKMIVTHDSRRIDVTKTEFELLLILMEAGGTVLSREEIMDRVWGSSYFGGSNVVDVHVKTLRKKLGDSAASPLYIVTVRGVGYRLAD